MRSFILVRSFILIVTALCVFCVSGVTRAADMPIALSASTELSSEGFLSLSWSDAEGSLPAALELASDHAFLKLVRTVPLNSQILEKGQVHISGLSDGRYYARLVAEDYSPLSSAAQFDVIHRDLPTALAIFAFGAALFIALIVVVIRFSSDEA